MQNGVLIMGVLLRDVTLLKKIFIKQVRSPGDF